jgi:hypothetical protein
VGTVVGGNTNSMYYSAVAFPSDQYIDVQVGALTGTGILESEARATLDSTVGYVIQAHPTVIVIAGGNLSVQVVNTNVNVGDRLRIECLGTLITFLLNGTILYQANDTGRVSGIPDISIAPSAAVSDTGFSRFEAGSISSGFAAKPIPTFATDAGPGTNTPVLSFGNNLGLEVHITPPDKTNSYLGANPVSPSDIGYIYPRPTTKEVITPSGVRFRNPA